MNNHLKTVLLLGLLTGLVLALGNLVAPAQLHFFVLLAAAMNLGAYFFSDRLVLRMSGAQEIPYQEMPELHDMVAELASKAGLPKPKVFLIPGEQPNAFATGRNPARGVVAVTTGLLRLLDRRELRGVIAHELAHIRNRDILVSSVAATAAAVVTYVANMLSWGAMFGGSSRDDDRGSPAAALVAIIVAPLAATLIQMGISRSREFLADESGAAICGDPEALANALRKLEQYATALPSEAEPATASLYIVNPFGGGRSAMRWFSTHPDTAERIERLMAMASARGAASGIAPGIPSVGFPRR